MHVVLFDGVCALCDASVRWLVGIDQDRVLHFAPLQGATASAVLSRHPEVDASLSTVVYVRYLDTEKEAIYARSDAAFAILRDLGGGWRALSWGRFIPRPLRDVVYDSIAKRRYRWFGKFDTCRLPETEDAGRFLP